VLTEGHGKLWKGPLLGERAERRSVVDSGSHLTVEEVKQAVRAKGGTLACLVCGREEGFALEVASVLGSGRSEEYGTSRLQRAQMVCENCGHAMNFDLARPRATGGA